MTTKSRNKREGHYAGRHVGINSRIKLVFGKENYCIIPSGEMGKYQLHRSKCLNLGHLIFPPHPSRVHLNYNHG